MKNDESVSTARTELVQAALQATMDLFLMMQSVTVAHWLSFELTFAQGKAVILIAAHKSVTISQLAKLLGVGKPTASILVQQLVERGLVTRTENPSDRRSAVVRLSEKGQAVGTGRRKEREAALQSWLSRLNDEDVEALARGLNALREVIHAESEA